jgi:hypothetical protein
MEVKKTLKQKTSYMKGVFTGRPQSTGQGRGDSTVVLICLKGKVMSEWGFAEDIVMLHFMNTGTTVCLMVLL